MPHKRENYNKYKKGWLDLRYIQGLCSDCPRELTTKHRRCTKCRIKRADASLVYRENKKDKNK